MNFLARSFIFCLSLKFLPRRLPSAVWWLRRWWRLTWYLVDFVLKIQEYTINKTCLVLLMSFRFIKWNFIFYNFLNFWEILGLTSWSILNLCLSPIHILRQLILTHTRPYPPQSLHTKNSYFIGGTLLIDIFDNLFLSLVGRGQCSFGLGAI